MVDHRSDPRPLIEQVATALRSEIRSGALPTGSKVPAERDLSARFGVSRDTVRRAVQQLTAEGLVVAGRGREGRRVRAYRPLHWNLHTFEVGQRRDDPAKMIDEWKADLLDQGVENPHHIISVVIQPIPTEFATKLGIESGAMAVRRRRLRMADNVPVAIADTWTSEVVGRTEVDGFAPLLAPHDVVLPNGIFAALGFPQTDLTDEISVRMPTPEEAELLQLPPTGSPVGQLDRVGYLENGDPVRVISTVFPGHRLKLRYQLRV